MALSHYVNTMGRNLSQRYGHKVHKIAIDAGFTCPNRDGTKGNGGCTFCNNVSFSPNGRNIPDVTLQIQAGKQVIRKRTGARKYIAYFQAYTNTYADVCELEKQYDTVLAEKDIIGLSVGTRADCVSNEVLDLLQKYQNQGIEVWLELGLQSTFDETLQKVNRGSDFADYQKVITQAQQRQIPVCTHLIIGLPGENKQHNKVSLQRVLDHGVQGLKLHPLHVVKGTQLANQWRQGEYQPLSMLEYIHIAADLIEMTPDHIVYHRVTGTAPKQLLLAPDWCSKKWAVLNGIENELKSRGVKQWN
ncbi:MAG: TIGR01212 family radical SAM protein [Methylococcales bacterium]|jgi:uncharacterized protein|nr:TIGR01212 family radical SAM protein [Methylococcales bacterium]MBT7410845.1 TIGR01212 family radical SAM protein [Methylococcales bacterium]